MTIVLKLLLLLTPAATLHASSRMGDGITSYDLAQVHQSLQTLLDHARRELDDRPQAPAGMPPAPPVALQLAFVSDSGEVMVQAGTDNRTGRAITAEDTFLFGSGTKPFIATRIFQLIEEGKLSASSLVAEQIDPLLRAMNQTSMVQLFGEPASEITVGELLRMASGIGNMDRPSWDTATWSQSRAHHHQVFSPFEFLHATQCEHPGPNHSCATSRMSCRPGPCRFYSSVNFEVAGLVVLRHDVAACTKLTNSSLSTRQFNDRVAEDECSWQNMHVRTVFGRSPAGRFPRMQFFNAEPINKWLSVAGWDAAKTDGNGDSYASVWEENSSVLGWTCGNMVAPAIEVARFFYDLLSPHAPKSHRLLHADSVAAMTKFQPFNTGPDAGIGWKLQYGSGLMRLNPACGCSTEAGAAGGCHYRGHGGDTYGFVSMNGFFPLLNASITLVMNQRNVAFLDDLQCQLVNVLYPLATYEPVERWNVWIWVGAAGGSTLIFVFVAAARVRRARYWQEMTFMNRSTVRAKRSGQVTTCTSQQTGGKNIELAAQMMKHIVRPQPRMHRNVRIDRVD